MNTFRSLALVAIVLASCGNSSAQPNVPQTDPIAELKTKWMADVGKFANAGPTKGIATVEALFLRRELETAPSNVVQAEVLRICATNVTSIAPSLDLSLRYDYALLRALVDLSIEEKRPSLFLQLLTNNCPGDIDLSPLEFRLAYRWKEQMTLLFDAYRSGRSDAVRKDIVGCLGRAFPSLHAQFPNEEEFVAAAEKWYKENQSKLQLNKFYPYLISRPRSPTPASKELFILDKVDDGASAVKGPAT